MVSLIFHNQRQNKKTFLTCHDGPRYLQKLVGKDSTIYYKGGYLERNLCLQLVLKCINLELIHLHDNRYNTMTQRLPIQKVNDIHHLYTIPPKYNSKQHKNYKKFIHCPLTEVYLLKQELLR